jgi:hypothetical protein
MSEILLEGRRASGLRARFAAAMPGVIAVMVLSLKVAGLLLGLAVCAVIGLTAFGAAVVPDAMLSGPASVVFNVASRPADDGDIVGARIVLIVVMLIGIGVAAKCHDDAARLVDLRKLWAALHLGLAVAVFAVCVFAVALGAWSFPLLGKLAFGLFYGCLAAAAAAWVRKAWHMLRRLQRPVIAPEA